jgi:phenylacetate-CoA ligase
MAYGAYGNDSYDARCALALDRALSLASFYGKWKNLDPGPSIPIDTRFSSLPVLTKKDLRAWIPDGFVYSDKDAKAGFASGDIELVPTSGTASERLSIIWNQAWWDRSEREGARINAALDRAFSQNHREAVLTTPVCAGNLCHVGDVPIEERILGNLLFPNQRMDPDSWGEKEVRRMAEELARFQPEVIEADPAYLARFSFETMRLGLAPFQPDIIVLTYEYPSRMHRRQIGRAFPGIPTVSSYGSTETGHVFTQCEAGLFHQNTASCRVDVQPFGAGRGDEKVGRILVTTLDHPWFALLRFDVGDLVRLRSDGEPCSCGRDGGRTGGGLTVESIEGRTRDLTFDSAGRAVTLKRLDDALGAAEGLLNYRIEQSAPNRFLARYTATTESESETADAIPDILRSVYGQNAEVEIRRDSAIGPEQSGKYRLARTIFDWNQEELFHDAP